MSLLGVETGAITPSISMGPGGAFPLNPMVTDKLVRTVVDATVLRSDMFELTFMDREGVVVDEAMIDIGTEITISLGSGPGASDLIVGEVTSIEGDFDEQIHYTIVRGFEHAHRLQRARRSRTFLDSTDGDIARRVANEASLRIGDIQDPGVTHKYVAQVAQTDWEFLKGRASEIGYETGVVGGEFFFRRAPGMSAGGLGGMAAAAGDMAASALGLGTPTLTFGENLRWLRPRVSSSGLVTEAEVRVWDPQGVQVVSGKAPLASKTASVQDDPASLAGAYGGPISLPAIPSIPFLPSFL